MLAERRQLGVRAYDVLVHVRRVRARVADPIDPLDRVRRSQELGEPAWLRTEPGAVRVDVLAEQRDLADAVLRQALDLRDELVERPGHLAPARARDDAERALHVAAGGDLDPALEVARPLGRQVAGEALELEEALGGDAVGGEELGELVHLAGAEGDVDERELAEHLLLDGLRPAAADPDDPLGVLALEDLGLVQMGDEAVVGLLADRAGVEEDELGVFAPARLRVAERLEHALHALGVVLVHLAAEGGDVEPLHVVEGTNFLH